MSTRFYSGQKDYIVQLNLMDDTFATATNTVTSDTTTNATVFPTFAMSASGPQSLRVSSSKLFFNPSTGLLTATGFAGPLTGLASQANSVTVVTDDTTAGNLFPVFTNSAGLGITVRVSNKISFNPSTGALSSTTFSTTGNVAVGGQLTVSGNLVVNGTTTTVNATTTTYDDPVITIGGDTAPTVDDNKDRGVEFRWHNGSVAKVGFFGFDDSTGRMIFIPDATNTAEVFSGTVGTIEANLQGTASGNAKLADTLTSVGTGITTNTTDWNTITSAGVYPVNGPGTWTAALNSPGNVFATAYGFGSLIVTVNGNIVTQTYMAHGTNQGRQFVRNKFNAADWNAWEQVQTSGNMATVTAAQGGTGQSVYAVGDILFANTTTTLARLADVATGSAIISGGVGVAPAWGKIGLTTHVTGTLPIANGGTNSAATPTAGTVAYGTGTAFAFTNVGTQNQVLISNAAAAPSFITLDMSYLPDAAFKKSVRLASTGNIVIATGGLLTVDGVVTIGGNRVLLKDQSAPAENGIYIVNAGAWTRALDADTASEIAGSMVFVDEGTANGGHRFVTNFKATDVLGTTALNVYENLDMGNAANVGIAVKTAANTFTGANSFRAGTSYTLLDPTDTTKQAQFDMSAITTATLRSYAFPNVSGALATLANIAQTFIGTVTFTNTLTSNGNTDLGNATGAVTVSVGAGVTSTGNTKAVNIGTNAATGATTNITFGSNTGTVTYTFNGTSAVKLPSGTTAQRPANSVGLIRYNSDTSLFEGSTASSWIPVGQDLTTTGARNRIMNGKMEIAQRGTSFVNPVSGAYLVDRFAVSGASSAAFTISQQNEAPANSGFFWSLRTTITTADTTIAAGDFAVKYQIIEGYNVDDLVGKTFTLSFWARSHKTGIHCVAVKNPTDRSYVAEYTINAANTWEYKTVTVTGGLPSTGTWNFTNGAGLIVAFALAAGTTYQTTANAWQTGAFFGTANQVNVLDTATGIFAITGVQLEAGSTATPFEHRPYGLELKLCHRYFLNIAGCPALAQCFGATSAASIFTLPTPMRSTPTLSVGTGWTISSAGGSGGSANAGISSLNGGIYLRIDLTYGAFTTAGDVSFITAPAGTFLSCEL